VKKYFYFKFVTFVAFIIILLDKITQILFKKQNLKNFLPKIHDMIEKKQYYSTKISNENLNFFCPSEMSLIRVQTLYTKEPETLNWMNEFDVDNEKSIFWDIGSNIGLYSIYAATMHKNLNVISFEPSTSNTRILSRNISINNLSDKIKIFQLPLSDKADIISNFNETQFIEGWSHSTFDNEIDELGEILTPDRIKNKYQIFGTSIDHLIEKNILDSPNYIKIDVDGIEHLILSGAKKLLKNKELKEILVELAPDNNDQYNFVEKILLENNFEKILSTNKRLLKDPNYKLKKGETLNTIFKRI
jgi:FkbM family methyltransferase